MPVRFNPSRNPATDKKWLLKDLLIETQKLDNRLSKLETATNLEYSWPRICKEATSLIIDRAKADTKTITKEISQEFQNAFVTTKTVYSKPSFEITAK